MKTKHENEDFETQFKKPIDFLKAVPSPYVGWSRRAQEREEQERRAQAQRKADRIAVTR